MEMKLNKKFWKNKNVLVTGFEGFLGSALVKRLVLSGANIIGLDIRVGRKETVLTNDDYDAIQVIKGSVTNYELLRGILKKSDIDIIFHLAAEAIVGECLQEPLKSFSTNIQGTWNILEAARLSVKEIMVIVASSDKAYGIHKELPYKENFALKGRYPYDVSKSCADLISTAYFNSYNLPLCIIRCGNIYGPGDFNLSRIVPDAMISAQENKTLLIRSNGKFMRDYIYIEDVVNGYMLAAEKMKKKKLCGESFNFSGEKPMSVLQVVKAIYKIAGKKLKYKILDQADYEIERQYLCSEKAGRLLGWKAGYTFESGLKGAFGWYRNIIK